MSAFQRSSYTLRTVSRNLTTFFSKWEILYHIGLMPILLPITNYYLIGPRYFSDWHVFASGTGLLFILFIFAVFVVTLAMRWVIRRYPNAQQSTRRTLILLFTLFFLTTALIVLDGSAYSLFPIFNVPFTWDSIRPVIILGLVFDTLFCTLLSLFYSNTQWRKDQAENEKLRQETLQNQLDTLKMKINPHFLFNSLTSLSSLISEDQPQAEQFVNQLSKVYRYFLQANTRELVSLQNELDFAASYTDLLVTRYGSSLRIHFETDPAFLEQNLPSLSLQTLIDNAIRHNSMSPRKPLAISIQTKTDGRLNVQNTLQRKTVKMDPAPTKLSNLILKYHLLGNVEVDVVETGTYFEVSLPLLPVADQIKPDATRL